MVHEVRLLLLQVGREALGLDALDSSLDGLTLSSAVSLFLFLDNLGETAVVALQGFAELGISLALVIEVSGVGCSYREEILVDGNRRWERFEARPWPGWRFLPSRPVMIVPADTATRADVRIMKGCEEKEGKRGKGEGEGRGMRRGSWDAN